MSVTFLTDMVFIALGVVIGNIGKISTGIFNSQVRKYKLNKLEKAQ